MSFYQKLTEIGTKFIPKHQLFKHGFNLSPMYRRTTARVTDVSADLKLIKIKLPISYKNRNYVNTIFGGSLFSAVDPFPMTQLMNLLDKSYVVWDRSAEIKFKRPANQTLYAEFTYSDEEIQEIIKRVSEEKEIDYEKITQLTNEDQSKVFCTVKKTLYIADKQFYKEKRRQREKERR